MEFSKSIPCLSSEATKRNRDLRPGNLQLGTLSMLLTDGAKFNLMISCFNCSENLSDTILSLLQHCAIVV